MWTIEELHQEAVSRAVEFRKSETRLLQLLDQIDKCRGFVKLGYPSMHVYCTGALGLSDAQAYSMLAVARKSREFPEIKQLVEEQKLHMGNATQIARVIDSQNKENLLTLGQTLSKRELEREIKKSNPEVPQRETMRPVSETQSEMKLVIPQRLEAKLKRLQDIYSKKKQKSLSLVETLGLMADGEIARHDPVVKAERNAAKPARHMATLFPAKKLQRREPVRALLRHQVNLRDKCQCTHRYKNGKRCDVRRFLQIHHVVPVAQGGRNTLGNLVTLCSSHHRFEHIVVRESGPVLYGQ